MKTKFLNALILLPILWLFSGFLLVKDGDKIMISMIIISIIVSIIKNGTSIIKKNIKDNKFLFLLIVITCYNIFSYYYHGQSSRETRAFIGCTLFILCFPKELLNDSLLRKLTLIGSISCFSFVYYYSIMLHIDRGSWPIIAIPQATLSAVIAIIAFSQFTYSYNRSQYIVAITAVVFSITAILMSETRGVFIAVILSFVFLFAKHFSQKKFNTKLVTIIFFIFISIGLTLKSDIYQRYEQTRIEMSDISRGDLNTSFGLRLLMWQTTPDMIKGHYLIGSGDGYINRFDELYNEGLISKTLHDFRPAHFHNQYIDKLIKNGIIGLVLLLLLILIPLIASLKKNNIFSDSVCGIVIIYAISALTDVPFYYGHPLMMYLILVSILTPIKVYNEKAYC